MKLLQEVLELKEINFICSCNPGKIHPHPVLYWRSNLMDIKTQGDSAESDEKPAKRLKLLPSNKRKVKSLNSTSFCSAFSSNGTKYMI